MRYRAFITLPWEFCIPRTTWRMWEVASCLGEMMLIQTNGLGDTVVVLPVGFGDDFGKAQLGGVQGDDEVVFIPVGESHEGITGGEVL